MTSIRPEFETARSGDNLVSRFFGFDRFLASGLIKFVYYCGLIIILLAFVIAVITGLAAMATASSYLGGVRPAYFLGAMLAYLIGTAIALIAWRFWCEVFILQFQIYNRLGDIRDRLAGGWAAAPSPGHVAAPPARPPVCGRCGAALAPEARFCTECGATADGRVGG